MVKNSVKAEVGRLRACATPVRLIILCEQQWHLVQGAMALRICLSKSSAHRDRSLASSTLAARETMALDWLDPLPCGSAPRSKPSALSSSPLLSCNR